MEEDTLALLHFPRGHLSAARAATKMQDGAPRIARCIAARETHVESGIEVQTFHDSGCGHFRKVSNTFGPERRTLSNTSTVA